MGRGQAGDAKALTHICVTAIYCASARAAECQSRAGNASKVWPFIGFELRSAYVKLSRIEKDGVWLLLNGDGTVIWVLGYRPDERFRVQPGCDKLLKISIL